MPPIEQLLWLSLGALALNALLLGLGLLARSGKLKRNPILGIRLPSTLKSDTTWYAAHRAASTEWIIGPIVGTIIIAAALILHSETSTILIAASVGVLLVAFIWGSITGTVTAGRIPRTKTDSAVHH